MREVQMKLKSSESYRENDLRVRNESLEKKRLIKELVRESPEYIQAISREVAREDGMLEVIENLRAEEAAGQQGGPPPGGGPMPEISAGAGGGATRALRGALTGSTAKPGIPPLPPNVTP